jgi:hypothetical protein
MPAPFPVLTTSCGFEQLLHFTQLCCTNGHYVRVPSVMTRRLLTTTRMLPHLSESDYRDPLWTVDNGVLTAVYEYGWEWSVSSSSLNIKNQYGIYLPSLVYWIELFGMLVIQMGVATVTGLFLYRTIIQPKRADTSVAFLIGLGVLLPFWVVWPMILIQQLDIRNTMFKFAVGCITPTLSIFRTLECIFGFTPTYATKSPLHYTFYFASIVIYDRDKNGDCIPCPLSRTVRHLRNFLLFQIITGGLQSMMTPYPSLAVFGGADDWYSHSRFVTWQLYGNSALQACK